MTVDVPQAPPLATVPGVELVQAGQWNLSTGPVTFTRADLAAAVAALDCPAVRRPILKLGHTDPRFDGEPAVGWVDNVALADSGNTIVGDYVGMPGWLGDILASAYPDRSIEGFFDFRCQLGHTHPFVVDAVALLGVSAPGVGTLESLQDVAALYGVHAAAEQPGEPVAITVHAKEGTMPNPRPVEVAAGVTSEDVRRAYYENAPWSTWITEMQLDPLQLITVDDDTGQYARVPITLNGDQVTFGDPVPVAIQYVDKPAQGQQTAASALVFASRAESRPPTGSFSDLGIHTAEQLQERREQTSETAETVTAAKDAIKRVAAASGLDPADETAPQTPPAEPDGETPKEEGDPMALDKGLRERLGLAEDADEETILTALDEALNPPTPEQQPEPAQDPAPVAASMARLPEGVVTIDETQLAELRTQAAEGVAARAQQRTEARDRALDDAVKAGKFPPARRDHWAKYYDADPDGAKQALASLAAGLVPVEDKGTPGGEEPGSDDEFDSLFPPHLRVTTKG